MGGGTPRVPRASSWCFQGTWMYQWDGKIIPRVIHCLPSVPKWLQTSLPSHTGTVLAVQQQDLHLNLKSQLQFGRWQLCQMREGKTLCPAQVLGSLNGFFFFNNYFLHSEHPHSFVSVVFSLNTGRCLKLPARSLENKYKALSPPSGMINYIKLHKGTLITELTFIYSCHYRWEIFFGFKGFFNKWRLKSQKRKRKKKMEMKKLHQNIKHGRISSQCSQGFLAKITWKTFTAEIRTE